MFESKEMGLAKDVGNTDEFIPRECSQIATHRVKVFFLCLQLLCNIVTAYNFCITL